MLLEAFIIKNQIFKKKLQKIFDKIKTKWYDIKVATTKRR